MQASAISVLLIKARIIAEAPSGREDRMKFFKREYAVGLLEDDVANLEETTLRSNALEELLNGMGFDPKEVRTRILRGGPEATPSPAKKMLSAANGPARPYGRVPEFPHLGLFANAEAPGSGGRTPMGSPEVDALRTRLEASEIKIASMAMQQAAGGVDLASVLEAQTKALVERLGQKGKSSTIRVGPRVTWPKLGDDGSGGREVE
jgi:hypothetical protein